ncbi:MAG: hypothetical protein ACD_45C00151G0007 [uncultured bacterium]|nr:MAG: hypothetical protein ACD_45C00151G0007 [uncultured bacterium]
MNSQSALEAWLTEQCQLTDYHVYPLLTDASFRRYFRVQHAAGSYVAMDASIEKQSCIPFTLLAKELRKQGLQAPEVIASDFAKGFLLLTDFGDRSYLKELKQHNADALYLRALDALAVLQSCGPVGDGIITSFTAEFMYNELMLFKEWFLEKHLALTLSAQTHKMCATFFDFLAKSAASQPQVFMHRDYHSANLMILPDDKVGILDFQDAFIGPITYDVVSLLRDCYIAWPEKKAVEWVTYYWKKLTLEAVSAEDFLRWFDLMGMQRHLKCLLTFARKYHRDHNANYLQHIPRTLNYILTVSQRYPESVAFNLFLRERVMEKCVE